MYKRQEEESAEVYLILIHMIANNVQGHSCFYYGYSSGNKFADMYQGFLDKVVRRLISNVSEHLILIGIEMGLDESSSATTNFYGNVRNAQVNQPSGDSTAGSYTQLDVYKRQEHAFGDPDDAQQEHESPRCVPPHMQTIPGAGYNVPSSLLGDWRVHV